MALTDKEKETLLEMERLLEADDPKFGSSMRSAARGSSAQPGLSLRGIALVVVGIVLLIGGVALASESMWFIALSVVGFLVMFGASVWMLNGGGKVNGGSRNPRSAKQTVRAGKSGGFGHGMGSQMEDSFRRRFER